MSNAANIRPAKISDAKMYVDHMQRHSLESGKDGDLVFLPYETPSDNSEEGFVLLKEGPWEKPAIEPGWERAWVLTDENQIFGDVILRHKPVLVSTLHRAEIMMGVERGFRAKGWGTKLMHTAIDWARTQDKLEWIILHVYENNPNAKRLYTKIGFNAVGTVEDCFRVFDQKIADTTMLLKLK